MKVQGERVEAERRVWRPLQVPQRERRCGSAAGLVVEKWEKAK